MNFVPNSPESKIPVFITARLGSTRLPGKHLLPIFGKPIIEHMIMRVREAKLPVFFVLCTTILPEDEAFVEIAHRCNIEMFRGHPTDILKRWLDAADQFHVQYFISAEADDVFCDPEYIDLIIEEFRKSSSDYITCRGLPFGVTPTGINVGALRKICELKEESDTEGQERFFTKTGLFSVKYIDIINPAIMHPEVRMTLDYPEDYEFFKEVFNHLYHGDDNFSLSEILNLLKEHPEIIEINKKKQLEYAQRYNRKYGKVQLKGEPLEE